MSKTNMYERLEIDLRRLSENEIERLKHFLLINEFDFTTRHLEEVKHE